MVGVIADDLTGAAELGGLAKRLGLGAAVNLGGALAGETDVVCLDTDSRACSAMEAARRAAGAAQRLKEAGAAWIYKKVDSVLRGQIIPEIEAILRQLGLRLVLLAPANPSLGRIIRKGNYFVANKPLNQTEFALDPAYPRTTSDVLGLLGPSEFHICCCRLESDLPEGGIVVAEAETSGDVADWASRWRPGMLAAGGAEFFGELVKRVHSPESRVPSPRCAVHGPESEVQPSKSGGQISDFRFEISESRGQGREVPMREAPRRGAPSSQLQAPNFKVQKELFVCGSMSESAREFVREAARSKTAAVFSLPEEIVQGAQFVGSKVSLLADEAAKALREQKRVILQIGLPPVGDVVLAARLALDLVKVAEAVLKKVAPARVFAEGGATAIELARRMGWESLSVVRELAPGVVGLATGAQSLEFIIKPGSYRWPEAVINRWDSNDVHTR